MVPVGSGRGSSSRRSSAAAAQRRDEGGVLLFFLPLHLPRRRLAKVAVVVEEPTALVAWERQ